MRYIIFSCLRTKSYTRRKAKTKEFVFVLEESKIKQAKNTKKQNPSECQIFQLAGHPNYPLLQLICIDISLFSNLFK